MIAACRPASRLVLAAGIGLLCSAVLAQPPVLNKEQLEQRLVSVARLIEQSSLARQIETSGNAGAQERREKARATYRQAQQARDAGDLAAAARLAAESSALMFEAAKRAGRDESNGARQQADFDARLQSVQSLLAAQQRISEERSGVPQAAETGRRIEILVAEATRLRAANRTAEAEAVLNKAYLLAKAAVSSLRRGETLVRSVHFARPEDEYRFELDRNETHMTLIKALTLDNPRIEAADGALEGFVNRAAELRRQADEASRAGDHPVAIRRLEDSTRELVRAIRSLGINIPG